MTQMNQEISSDSKCSKGKTLSVGTLAHFIHDGFTDMLYIFFPIWQAQWGMSFAEIGFLKTLASGSTAGFQIPVGIAANRLGQMNLLVMGTVITSLTVILWGWAVTPMLLAMLLVLGGVGASVQHPISSAVISDAYSDGAERRRALSTYNVSGDVGKLVLPGVAAYLIAHGGWQSASQCIGWLGVLTAALLFVGSMGLGRTRGHTSQEKKAVSVKDLLLGWDGYQPFWALSAIGVIDSATRMGFLTFLPFLLQDKGAGVTQIGVMLMCIFAGGALGKLVCGIMAIRVGVLPSVVITEGATALCIGMIIILPLEHVFFLAPVLGIALNGTSSVLYGSVPELIPTERRNQGFAIFYTMSMGAGAIAPVAYGFLGDRVGVTATVLVVAAVVLLAIPLAGCLRGKVLK